MSLITRNVGSTDKILRLVAGLILGAWSIFGAGLSGTLAIIAAIVAVVLIATGLLNFCPLFKLLGINSIRN